MFDAMLFVFFWRSSPRRVRIFLAIALSVLVLSTMVRAMQATSIQLELSFKKVHDDDYEVAYVAYRNTTSGHSIPAPEQISAWIATMSHDRQPVVVRPLHFYHFEKSLGAKPLESSKLLHNWVTNLSHEDQSTNLNTFGRFTTCFT